VEGVANGTFKMYIKGFFLILWSFVLLCLETWARRVLPYPQRLGGAITIPPNRYL